MCFFYALPEKPNKIAKTYGRQLTLFDEEEMDRKYIIKGFDHTQVNPIITEEKELQKAHWGLIPFWSKPDYAEKVWKDNYNVNAKEETIFTLPSFRLPIKQRRCLVPAAGWYEYHYENRKVKDVYYIYVKDTELFSFAGIYDIWHDKESGNQIMTYAIITTQANDLMHFIHNGGKNPNRMPVIIPKEKEEIWLNPDTTETELKSIMQPYPAELMDAYTVEKNIRSKNPFDPSSNKPKK